MMNENAQLGIKVIRNQAPALYSWLYRNDRTWLKQNSSRRKMSKAKVDRVDWLQRDLELSVKVLEAAATMNSSESKPEMITVTSIGRLLGRLSLFQKHIDKLPLTKERLSIVIDSPESFAVQRLKWVHRSLSSDSKPPKKWKVLRLAGIGRWMNNRAVLTALDELKFYEE